MRFTLLFTFLLGCCLAQAQYASLDDRKRNTPTDARVEAVPDKLVRKYKRDAARLALRLEAGPEDLRFSNIDIPYEKIESIFEMLKNIYLSGETGKSIARCNVHTFPNPSIDQIKIIYSKDAEWANLLNEGIAETTSEEFNDLLDEYDLVIENQKQWTDTEDVMVIRAAEPINMAALANEFYNIEGITEIDLGIPEVKGNDIEIEQTASGWNVKYILTIGSSLLDTTRKQHVWEYEISEEGNVTFINEDGEPIPDWMKCENTPVTNLYGG